MKSVKELTPEQEFKKELLSLFNSNGQAFHKSTSCVKNVYMYWYNCGFTSPRDIKNMIKSKYPVDGSTNNDFNVLNQLMKCHIKVTEDFHMIEITFS